MTGDTCSMHWQSKVFTASRMILLCCVLQALTSTADGDVVVWDEQGQAAQMGTRATDRRAIKIMRLHGSAIHHLSTIGDFVVSGEKTRRV